MTSTGHGAYASLEPVPAQPLDKLVAIARASQGRLRLGRTGGRDTPGLLERARLTACAPEGQDGHETNHEIDERDEQTRSTMSRE